MVTTSTSNQNFLLLWTYDNCDEEIEFFVGTVADAILYIKELVAEGTITIDEENFVSIYKFNQCHKEMSKLVAYSHYHGGDEWEMSLVNGIIL